MKNYTKKAETRKMKGSTRQPVQVSKQAKFDRVTRDNLENHNFMTFEIDTI